MVIFSYVCYGAASVLLLFLIICVLRIFTGKSLGSKEYPPVKGTIFDMFRRLDWLYDSQAEDAAHNKTCRYLAFSQSEVYTADPLNIEYILKTNFANYDKGAYHQEIMKDLLGEGIFAIDGQKWRHQRKVASHEFSTKVLRDFSSVVFRRNAAVLAQRISENAEANLPMDMHDRQSACKDDVLPDGFKVKKGDGVNHVTYAMGRMKYIWGDDAEEFRPERWLHDGVFKPESPFKFPAFHAGPRACLGKDFAYRQMKIVAALLTAFFRFKLKDPSKEVTYKTMLTLHIDQGLHVRVLHRLP